jgi:hypothetical protein
VSNKSFFHEATQGFAASVKGKITQLTAGELEDHLRGLFGNLIAVVGQAIVRAVVCTGETSLPDRPPRPDYASHLNHFLGGNVELKTPGIGANAKGFRATTATRSNASPPEPCLPSAYSADWLW